MSNPNPWGKSSQNSQDRHPEQTNQNIVRPAPPAQPARTQKSVIQAAPPAQPARAHIPKDNDVDANDSVPVRRVWGLSAPESVRSAPTQARDAPPTRGAPQKITIQEAPPAQGAPQKSANQTTPPARGNTKFMSRVSENDENASEQKPSVSKEEERMEYKKREKNWKPKGELECAVGDYRMRVQKELYYVGKIVKLAMLFKLTKGAVIDFYDGGETDNVNFNVFIVEVVKLKPKPKPEVVAENDYYPYTLLLYAYFDALFRLNLYEVLVQLESETISQIQERQTGPTNTPVCEVKKVENDDDDDDENENDNNNEDKKDIPKVKKSQNQVRKEKEKAKKANRTTESLIKIITTIYYQVPGFWCGAHKTNDMCSFLINVGGVQMKFTDGILSENSESFQGTDRKGKPEVKADGTAHYKSINFYYNDWLKYIRECILFRSVDSMYKTLRLIFEWGFDFEYDYGGDKQFINEIFLKRLIMNNTKKYSDAGKEAISDYLGDLPQREHTYLHGGEPMCGRIPKIVRDAIDAIKNDEQDTVKIAVKQFNSTNQIAEEAKRRKEIDDAVKLEKEKKQQIVDKAVKSDNLPKSEDTQIAPKLSFGAYAENMRKKREIDAANGIVAVKAPVYAPIKKSKLMELLNNYYLSTGYYAKHQNNGNLITIMDDIVKKKFNDVTSDENQLIESLIEFSCGSIGLLAEHNNPYDLQDLESIIRQRKSQRKDENNYIVSKESHYDRVFLSDYAASYTKYKNINQDRFTAHPDLENADFQSKTDSETMGKLIENAERGEKLKKLIQNVNIKKYVNNVAIMDDYDECIKHIGRRLEVIADNVLTARKNAQPAMTNEEALGNVEEAQEDIDDIFNQYGGSYKSSLTRRDYINKIIKYNKKISKLQRQ